MNAFLQFLSAKSYLPPAIFLSSCDHGFRPYPRHGHSHQQHSSTELLSSAKLVAQAAQSTLRHESHKVDKTHVAHAAGDLLEAACHYGKLEDKSFGKYVDKAEDYPHKYGSSSSSNSAKPAHQSHGHGDYLKMAQGFLGGSGSEADFHSSKPGHTGSGGRGSVW